MPIPTRPAAPTVLAQLQQSASSPRPRVRLGSCDEDLWQFVEEWAEAVAEQRMGADEPSLGGEIGGIH